MKDFGTLSCANVRRDGEAGDGEKSSRDLAFAVESCVRLTRDYRSDSRARRRMAERAGRKPPRPPMPSERRRPVIRISGLTTICRTTDLPPPGPLETTLRAVQPSAR